LEERAGGIYEARGDANPNTGENNGRRGTNGRIVDTFDESGESDG